MQTITTKLPDRFHSFEGTLYRDGKPFRANYATGHRRIRSVSDMKSSLRNGPYAWPGGYPILYVTSDGALLCSDCARKNFRNIADDIRSNGSTGWRVEASCIEAVSAECAREAGVDTCYCDQCNEEFGELS